MMRLRHSVVRVANLFYTLLLPYLLLLNLLCRVICHKFFFFFFFNDTATTEIYTLSLHDALPIYTILHELNPLFTINVTMRDIKSKNVYSRVNSKATTQWRKTESANGVHLEGVASDNRSS